MWRNESAWPTVASPSGSQSFVPVLEGHARITHTRLNIALYCHSG